LNTSNTNSLKKVPCEVLQACVLKCKPSQLVEADVYFLPVFFLCKSTVEKGFFETFSVFSCFAATSGHGCPLHMMSFSGAFYVSSPLRGNMDFSSSFLGRAAKHTWDFSDMLLEFNNNFLLWVKRRRGEKSSRSVLIYTLSGR
jgi:hypothetical protein